jgi:hypothetical protein
VLGVITLEAILLLAPLFQEFIIANLVGNSIGRSEKKVGPPTVAFRILSKLGVFRNVSERFAVKSGVALHHTLTRCLPFLHGHPTGAIPRCQTSVHGRCTPSANNPKKAFLPADESPSTGNRLAWSGGQSELDVHH